MAVLSNKTSKIAAGAGAILLIGAGIWWGVSHNRSDNSSSKTAKHSAKKADPFKPVVDAYNAGRYKDAEASAQKIIDSAAKSNDPDAKKNAVRARYILAFGAARRKDLKLARDRFTDLQKEAAKLPRKDIEVPQPGNLPYTLEEDGAYQHAVCTAALGDKKTAIAEYIQFIKDYPESPLVHGAMMRIQRINKGNSLPEADAAFKQAMAIMEKKESDESKARMRELSMCGPECLAELLHRRGENVDYKTLASEMKTSDKGTSLKALVDAANKRSLKAKGLALTQKGLAKQRLPLIALLSPGHYVIVERVTDSQVQIWDPGIPGIQKVHATTYPLDKWSTTWTGIALVVQSI